MSDSLPPTGIQLGFLTILQDGQGFLGGYLVTNSWGRPLEFRLSTAVQPNRVQQILYGPTLHEYLCADLIGKTLIEKTAAPCHLLLTDSALAFPIRSRLPTPVLLAPTTKDAATAFIDTTQAQRVEDGRFKVELYFDPRFDSPEALRTRLDRIDGSLDLAEPFLRIREAVTEARKMGVVNRAA